jgi:hypothetical protein
MAQIRVSVAAVMRTGQVCQPLPAGGWYSAIYV